MIQRIQTIYLAIAAFCAAILVMVAPVLVRIDSAGVIYQLRPFGIYVLKEGVPSLILNAYPLAGTSAVIILLCVYSIFQFSNRKFQIILARIAQLGHLIQVGFVMFYMDKMESLAITDIHGRPTLWLLLPVIGLITAFFAVRAIQKDDDLVRSADRLR